MLHNTFTFFLLIIASGVSTWICEKGCKCKLYGYCSDCETGYFKQDNECKSCLKNCLSCSSGNICEKCENEYYRYEFNRFNISCRPCSIGCTKCTSESNCSQCSDGYLRDSKNRCTKCLPQCKTCMSESNCSECTDGFNLNGTSCQKCADGFFQSGSSCLPCQKNCATCSIINECNGCKQGFFGDLCDQRCSPGCKNNSCDPITGNCTCKENYVGNGCNQCKPQKFGLDCNLNCSKGCLNCDSIGNCNVCNSGYFRIKCNCSDGCLNKKCDRWTGQCLKCKPGKWGQNCTNDCPIECFHCMMDTNCTMCNDGFYYSVGQCLNCPTNCLNASCNSNRGSCDEGCKPGYWGIFCNKSCPENCLNKTCHKENGTCALGCKMFYHGIMCDCQNNCICNRTGQCLFSCRNFKGDDGQCNKHCISVCLNCSHGKCERCGNNTFYGQFCDHECSNNCIDRICDTLTGKCTSGCREGYFGDKCSKHCKNSCRKSSCNKKTGLCDDEDIVDEPSSGLSQDIYSFLFVSVAILIIAIILSIISALNSLRNKRHRRVIASLRESTTYERESNSEALPACERIVEQYPDMIHLDLQSRDDHNAIVLGGASPIVCEPTVHGNVYVNLEYASIDRNQFLYINEEGEDEIQSEDDINEVVEDFIYVNTEEYLKRRVPVYQLHEFVKNKTRVDYAEEFKKLPPGLIKPFNESQMEENMMKNRYKGVYPYDSRRVKVRNRESDYINASYVDGYRRQKAYIASLGPTVKQMGADFGVFWNMVWQEKVCKIVMLTNLIEQGVKKCDKYWPDKDICCTYEGVKVHCQSEEIYPYFTVRVFSVEKIEKRILYQMHFTAWPDKSTPKDVHGMLEFWEKLTRIPKFELGPIIVHCSAGVGRTGTFIALDILAKEGVSEGTVDIFACVRNLREDRVSLIQTVEQYIFLHEALVQLLFSDTSVKALLTNEENIQEKTLEETEQVTRR